MRTCFAIAVMAALFPCAALDFANLGPAAGQKFPDFSAPDQNGNTVTLASLLKSNGAVIVFFRSADW